MAVGARADVDRTVHHRAAERALRPAGVHYRLDLAAQRPRLSHREPATPGGRLGVLGFRVVGEDDELGARLVEAEAELAAAKIDLRAGRDLGAGHEWGGALAQRRAPEPHDLLLQRGAERRELLLLHPQRGEVAAAARDHAEGALAGLADRLRANAVQQPKVVAALRHPPPLFAPSGGARPLSVGIVMRGNSPRPHCQALSRSPRSRTARAA